MSDEVLDREFQPLFRTDTIHLQSMEGNGCGRVSSVEPSG